MSGKKDAEKAKTPTPLDIFVGIKGRLPPVPATRWGEGRS